MSAFKPLPPQSKKDLLYIKDKYKNGSNIEDSNDIKIVENLKIRGYFNLFNEWAHGAFRVNYSGDDLDYEFNEEQYNKTQTTTQNITNYNNSSIQTFNNINNSTITAIQNNNEKSDELIKLINKIKLEMDGLSEDKKGEITENLDFISEETKKAKPKLNMIKSTLNFLSSIQHTVEFAAAVASIITFLQ